MQFRVMAAGLTLVDAAGCGGPTDGTDGNPPGMGAGLAMNRAAGSNVSGTYHMRSDGMSGNPAGTAIGRTIDRAAGSPGSR